jgi:[ribosomal protein S5]-alanine N-acetyltransferase
VPVRVVGETPRLRLREWHRQDGVSLQGICGDLEVVRYLGGSPWTADDTREFLDDMLTRRELGAPETWAIEDLATGRLIGWCGFARTNAPWLRYDLVIEIGWTLARSCWGLGLATEAARAALDLELFDPARIISKCHAENSRSEAVMRRIGMHRVGEVRARYDCGTTLYRF